MEEKPNVVACFWCHDNKGNLLLQRRNGNHRDHTNVWDPGAGLVHYGESIEQAMRREVQEEYSVVPLVSKLLGFREFTNAAHNITFDYLVVVRPEDVCIGEPHKIDEIKWFPFHALPPASEMHPGVRQAILRHPFFEIIRHNFK